MGYDNNKKLVVLRWYGRMTCTALSKIKWQDAVIGVIRVFGESDNDEDPPGYNILLSQKFAKDMRGVKDPLGIKQNWNFQINPDGTVDTLAGWNP